MSDHYDRYNGMKNLLGTDCISRQAAIDALTEYGNGRAVFISVGEAVIRIEQLPPIQPVNCSEFPNNSDTISRQAAIEAADAIIARDTSGNNTVVNAMIAWREYIKHLQHAQPEIIRCRNCKFASGDSRICMKFGHSPIGELDFCSFAERREVTT